MLLVVRHSWIECDTATVVLGDFILFMVIISFYVIYCLYIEMV